MTSIKEPLLIPSEIIEEEEPPAPRTANEVALLIEEEPPKMTTHEAPRCMMWIAVLLLSYWGLLYCLSHSTLNEKIFGLDSYDILSFIFVPVPLMLILYLGRDEFPENITEALAKWGFVFRSFIEFSQSFGTAFVLFKFSLWECMDIYLVCIFYALIFIAISMNRMMLPSCQCPNPTIFVDFCTSLVFYSNDGGLVARACVFGFLCFLALLVANFLKYKDHRTITLDDADINIENPIAEDSAIGNPPRAEDETDGNGSEVKKQDNADMAALVQNLLQQMQSRFQTIITKIDGIGNKINELEQSINDLRSKMDADKSHFSSGP